MNGRPEFRVVKVGGSLFDLDDLPTRLLNWLDRETHSRTILIAGGGAAVDILRAVDARFGLSPALAHELALRQMSINARLLCGLLPRAGPVLSLVEMVSLLEAPPSCANGEPENSVYVLDASADMLEPPHRDAVPASWEVTSDSIAAYVAQALGGAPLFLLKSRPPEPGREAEVVDGWFLNAARGLGMATIVDLRQDGFPEYRWRLNSQG